MQQKIIIGVALAALTVGYAVPSDAFFFRAKVNTGKHDNRKWDNRNATQNSHNRRSYTRQSIYSTSDSRRWYDNRNLSDHRVDARNMSDNRIDNQRHQAHNFGDGNIVMNDGYQPRVGHKNSKIEAITGDGNIVDNSVAGDFSIGHK